MKLWSKEALVLGGMYGVLETPFTYLGFETVTDIFFVVFICCMVLLCFNKIPKFISKTIENYPKVSYYLASIGWIPYFVILVTIIISGIYYCLGYDGALFSLQIFCLGIIVIVANILSLLCAYVRYKRIMR